MLSPYSPFYCAHCIQCRLPERDCVCAKISQVSLPFHIMLCSHPKEWQRNDNTGQWGLISSPNIERVKWQRKSERIKTLIPLKSIAEQKGHYLLFPSEDAQDINLITDHIQQLWVIDGTWQETQKMLRQSPWLKNMTKVKIQAPLGQSITSEFQLRRNQQGLATLEAICYAVAIQDPSAAQKLTSNFHLCQNALLKLLK
jgi:tRNA-uridine aminocarboxypropyltransferase